MSLEPLIGAEQATRAVESISQVELDVIAGQMYELVFTDIYTSDMFGDALVQILDDDGYTKRYSKVEEVK